MGEDTDGHGGGSRATAPVQAGDGSPDYLVSARGRSPALDAGQLEVLRGYGTERDVAAGEVLFADGDETYDLIVMLDGTAEIIQGYGQPGARLIAGYGRSQFRGEIGMLTGQRRARGGRSAPQKMRRGAELPKRRESAKTDRCRYHQDDAAHHLLRA